MSPWKKVRLLTFAVFIVGFVATRASIGQIDFEAFPDFRDMNGGAIVSADFDGDGHSDIAVRIGFGVDVYWGDGDGAFTSPSRFDMTGASFLAAGDFNEDGLADLAGTYFGRCDPLFGELAPGIASILSSGAGRTFLAARDIRIGLTSKTLVVADQDRDGHLDLAILMPGAPPSGRCGAGNTLVIRLGAGDGTFPLETLRGVDGYAMDVADFDEDGALDVVLARWSGEEGDVGIHLGDGAAMFADAIVFGAGGRVSNLKAADLDADSHADLAVLRADDSTAHVLFGDGTGQLGSDVPSPHDLFPERVADLDADGDLDRLALIDAGLRVSLGDGIGGFAEPVSFAARGDATALADVDEDGLPDVASNGGSVLVNSTSRLAEVACRAGNVNVGAGGERADVLLVNGAVGLGPARRLTAAKEASLRVEMLVPPGGVDASFALYAWLDAPTPDSVTPFPAAGGTLGMRPPSLGGTPKRTWNNTGDAATFGVPNRASRRAPSVVLDRRLSQPRQVRFYVQGVIQDATSPTGFAVTNGIEVQLY